MGDADQPGENVDEELLGGEYPPEEPLAVGDDEEPATDEEDLARPEGWEADAGEPADRGDVELVGDAGADDVEKDLVGERADTGEDEGPLAPDDEFSGDETTRDVVTERQPPAAEDAAVHVVDEDRRLP